MTVSSTDATASDVLLAPIPVSANRFELLEEPPYDDEAAKLQSKFQAQGVYKPPHMRTPSESTTSIAESDPMVGDTATIRPPQGSGLDHEKGPSRPPTSLTSSTPVSLTFGFGAMKKLVHEELLNVRKAVEEMETMEKELLEEEARFKRHIQVMRSGGLTDEQIQAIVDLNPARLPSRPPTVQPLDINSVTTDLACVDLGSEQKAERLVRKHPAQLAEDELANRTPIPGGPMYSPVNHPRGVRRAGRYGYRTFETMVNDAQQNTAIHQTSWNEQTHAYTGVTGRHGSAPSENFQMPGQIYQATPGMRFNPSMDSLPPRFRLALAHTNHQPTPLHCQSVIQNRPKDIVSVDHPVPWPPVLNQPQNSISNHTFRPTTIPPPPRPYFYEVDLVFDFESVALSSNCNRDVFVKTYWKMNGFSPSQAAWAAWASAVAKLKRAQQYEQRKAMEQETRERYGAGSRLPKWSSNLMEDLPGDDLGHSSSSSDASTKVTSSRTSEAGDEGSVVVNTIRLNGKREIGAPRVQKRWKDVADMTWEFEPPRSDDPGY